MKKGKGVMGWKEWRGGEGRGWEGRKQDVCDVVLDCTEMGYK